MPHIKANNINMFYEYEGKGEPLVIIGGFASVHHMWKEFIKPLQKNYKILIFDNRGFGDTDVTPSPYSIEMMAKDTSELMNSLNIDSAYVLGHSMGSSILQRMCLDYPNKIKKAILSGTFMKIPFVSQMIFEIIPELFAQNIDEDLVRKIIMPWMYSSDFLANPDNLNKTLENMRKRKVDPIGYDGQSHALRDFDSKSWASKITSNILVLVGREDIDTPLYCSEEIMKKLKNAKLKIVEKAAHMHYQEQPKEVLKIIMDFFK